MKNSLETAVEDFFIQRYQAHPSLSGKTIVHFDENREAQSNCIIVHATVGQHQNPTDASREAQIPPILRDLNGAKTDAYNVQVEVTYRAPQKATIAANNLVSDALTSAIFQTGRRSTTAEQEFAYLLILDPMTGNRDHTESLRRITRTFSLVAKLSGEPVNVLAYG